MSNAKHTPLMHPNNCMCDCAADSCVCTPKRHELKMREHMERIAYCSCGWTPDDYRRFARGVLAKARGE